VVRISLLLWDVGGVLLSNAWDHEERQAAAKHFGLDPVEFERRHDRIAEEFETGQVDEETYLSRTVFDVPRPFTRDAFRQFMRDQSVAIAPSLATARSLRRSGQFVMAALNNESEALNDYRIVRFGLKEIFHVFFSSCYIGRRKPDPAAYRYALRLAQCEPEEGLFIDDRKENVEAAGSVGLRTVWVHDPGQLRDDLASVGVIAT
jgi:putative hydrolase of the HAD superfamily